MSELKQYLKRLDTIYIPYVAEKFGMSTKQMCFKIIDLWDMFDNPHMVNDTLVPDKKPESWWYEVCDTKYKRGSFVNTKELQDHWLRNQKYDQHISVFAHDSKWVKNLRESGSVSCRQTRLKSELFWIELDRKNYNKDANFQQAVSDAQKLRNRILIYAPNTQVWVFTSGNNSTHIAINSSVFGNPVVDQKNSDVFRELAELITERLRFDMEKSPRKMTEKELKQTLHKAYPELEMDSWDAQRAEAALENCDTQIYHVNALIRQPWSWHESGKKRKSLVSMGGDFMYEPERLVVDDLKPKMLYWYIKAWEKLKNSKEKRQKKFDNNYTDDYIIDTYKKHYPQITEMRPDEDGWIGRFHSIFYEDGNPDVSINIYNGFHHDFGSHRYSMSFEEFITKTRKTYD